MWRNIFRPAPPEQSPPPGWEARQAAIIAAPADARLLVDGGPGTGKTAIACARVARLISQEGVAPTAIWLVSFTRTAISEIRGRIAEAVGDAALAQEVRISTLDSLAWAIQPTAEADEGPEGDQGYDDNIARILDLVKTSAALTDRFAAIGHVIVDEAHDIVGLRAELVAAMVDRLGPATGLTVFLDEAQAIYGFADRAPGWGREPLLDRLRRRPDFQLLRLETVFRSREPNLTRIFRETRRRVLDDSGDAARRLKAIRRQIARLADGRAGDILSQDLGCRDDTLVLFRRRAEVLAASARLHGAGIAHRLRLSGHPAGLAPWLAAALGGDDGSALSEGRFAAGWDEHVAGTALATESPKVAWAALARLAPPGGNGFLDMALLRRRLAGERPPIELCLAEAGASGPILGTIHASKGREADVVHLMLPKSERGDPGEEARIAFVGATRARRRLLVGTVEPQPAERLESGRLYRLDRDGAEIELGRVEDIDSLGLAGRGVFADAAAVAAAQARLRALAGRLVALEAVRSATGYHLAEPGGPVVAVLGRPVTEDLAAIATRLSRSRNGGPFAAPARIGGLWMIGLRSVALGADDRLHRPYAGGGLLLCPIIAFWGRAALPSLASRPERAT